MRKKLLVTKKYRNKFPIYFLLFSFWFAPSHMTAQVSPGTTATDQNSTNQCPNPEKLRHLCMMISGRTKDSSGRSKYLYQTRFLEAGCVESAKDSELVANEKIKLAWDTFESKLICNSTQFDVSDGHLMKYAVSYKFDEFIRDAIRWKVNLNKVDASDGRTVLDYVKFHIDRNKGNVLESKFLLYYDMLRKAGAKHRSEL